MSGSQLKRLKASLHEIGVIGSTKSKKQRKSNSRDAQKRVQRNTALDGVREHFNPFEAKAPARRDKFEIASNKPAKRTIERPGVTRGLGEERRRETLLKEMQRRNKVGGLLDRRFGEDDPNMTPEQKAAERFAQQALRASKKNSMFNLEEGSEEELQLTHGGRALALDADALRDDFSEDISGSDADDFDGQDHRPRKRVRLTDIQEQEESEDKSEEDVLQRKKSKHEVMQEVIAKSKAYKAARQAAKEDDDDLRMELDKGMNDLFSALQSRNASAKQLPSPPFTDSEPALDPSRAAILAGKSREEAEKEYEANLRQLKLEARSKPSVRTKSEEEKAAEEKARLEDLEKKRIRRMKGEPDTSDDEAGAGEVELDTETNEELDDAGAFGLEQPRPQPRYIPQLEVEDEDEFVIDDIVASDPEADVDSNVGEDDYSSILEEEMDDGEDDFINGLVLPKGNLPATQKSLMATASSPGLPYTFPCPQTHGELVRAMHDIRAEDLPTVVQRIRALYHKGLAQENEERLGNFAKALIPWISDLVNGESKQYPSMQVVEQIIRHLHSMAKAQSRDVATGFRKYFRGLLDREHDLLSLGDLIVLTSILTIYPTSDQWHTVVTPATLLLARYLAQTPMESLVELAKGTYACSLLLQYHVRSKRYVPEVINFIHRGLQSLAPLDTGYKALTLSTPKPIVVSSFRISQASEEAPVVKPMFEDLRVMAGVAGRSKQPCKMTSETLLLTLLNVAKACCDCYSSKSAFPEIMAPIQSLVGSILSQKTTMSLLHPKTKSSLSELSRALEGMVKTSIDGRKPLLLHNHRPLAIKSSYPAFSDNYNPERRQQDPDRDRAELNKLKAEHKKERKGAMRELRKDANFMAREQLREKKAKDEAYEKKFKRLVAEIQGEEGREAHKYEREKAKRKGRF